MIFKIFEAITSSTYILWKLLMFLCMAQGYGKFEKEKILSTTNIEAIEGHKTILYCPLTSPSNDKINMVLWFKENAGIPLYSFDVRGKSLIEASYWSDPKVFGTRAKFNADFKPSFLEIKDIKRHDQGIYRCRVDYQNSQTISLKFNLTVIILPEAPIILDRWGRVVNKTTIGPKEEGDDVILTCRVVGGRPQPDVRWLVNGVLVDDQYENNSGDVIENRLLWPSIKRKDLYSVFTCQAINTKLVEGREKRLVLDMFLKPNIVNILNTSMPLVADRKYEIQCLTSGSRPEAVITWFKGKKPLKRTRDLYKINATISILNFVPTVEDNGKTLTCHAENPSVSGLNSNHSWNMNIFYPPIVSLQLGSKLQMEDIKEGDDVYFECKIEANPQWRKLTWLHNGKPLSTNSSTKIITSNQSLVLQKVTRSSSGVYQCGALNSEGETVSNSFLLKVKFAPHCVTDKLLIVGTSKGEQVQLMCEVNSYPQPKRFFWKFENSEESVELDQKKYIQEGSRSILIFSTITDHDYGSLSCWAKNEIGVQVIPCVFQLILAGPPSPVTNCTWANETENSLNVNCNPNYDGGLSQTFFLEIVSLKLKTVIFNISNPVEPIFRFESNKQLLSKLMNSNENDILRIYVFSKNQKGKSQEVFITELCIGNLENQSSNLKRDNLTTSPILVGAFFIVLILGAILIIKLFLKTKLIKKKMEDDDKINIESRCSLLQQETFTAELPTSSKILPGISIKTRDKVETIDDEQDPDLIPQYPRLTTMQHEELIPMNTGSFSYLNSHKGTDFLTDVEINFNGLMLNGKVSESCI